MAIDCGLAEKDFWEMTFAEIDRYIDGYNRKQKRRAQEQASFDYILADLIGRSISRVYSSSVRIPDIAEVYPTIFDTTEVLEDKRLQQAELSAIRFRQFADSYNKRWAGK